MEAEISNLDIQWLSRKDFYLHYSFPCETGRIEAINFIIMEFIASKICYLSVKKQSYNYKTFSFFKTWCVTLFSKCDSSRL